VSNINLDSASMVCNSQICDDEIEGNYIVIENNKTPKENESIKTNICFPNKFFLFLYTSFFKNPYNTNYRSDTAQ
jgi:hypothetical protein